MKFSHIAITLAVVTGAAEARAANIAVYYEAANAPGGYNSTIVMSMLRTAFRQFEANSEGHVTFDGPYLATTSPTGPGVLRVFWDPTLTGLCARAVYPCGVSPLQCSIALSPVGLFPPSTLPQNNRYCQNLYPTILHELAHHAIQPACGGWHLEWVRDRYVWFDNCHASNSTTGFVMASDGFGSNSSPNWIDDVGASHLWNHDMENFAYFYGEHPRTTRYRFMNESGIEYHSVTAIGNTQESNNHTHAISNGPSSALYARAYALSRTATPSNGVFFDRGDLLDGGAGNTTRIATGGTSRSRVCVAATPFGNEVIVLNSTASEDEVNRSAMNITLSSGPIWTGAINYPTAGARGIQVAESSDGGDSFRAPFNLPYATTKGGISCAYDPASNNFVIAYEGAGENAVWFAHRNATALSSWSYPYRIDENSTTNPAVTLEPPHIYFDSHATTIATGHLTWAAADTWTFRHDLIEWDPFQSRYYLTSTPSAPVLAPFPSNTNLWSLPIVASLDTGITFNLIASGNERLGGNAWANEALSSGGLWGATATDYSISMGTVYSDVVGVARPRFDYMEEIAFVSHEYNRDP